MAEKGKFPILLLVLIILVSLALAGGTYHLLQKEKAKNVTLQKELEEVKTQQSITEARLKESQKIVSNFEAKLREAQSQIDSLSNQLQQERTSREEAQAQIEQLKVDLEQQRNLRSDLENKLTQAQKDLDKTQVDLNDLKSKKSELEAKLSSLETQQSQGQGVELGKIVVGPESNAATQTTIEPGQSAPAQNTIIPAAVAVEGRVLVVNKEYDFIVINLGTRDGAVVGNVYSVYHNDEYLGDVKIEKVHDSMSAAGFISPDVKNKVSEGDKVVLKK